MPKCTTARQQMTPLLTRRTLLGAAAAAALASRAHPSLAGMPGSLTQNPGPEPQASGIRIHFVRHAESEFDMLRTVDVPVALPPDDELHYPLTSTGMQQARALGEQLQHDPVLAVVSSPRLRCVQTADAIAFASGTTIEIAKALADVDFGEPKVGPAPTTYLATMQTLSRWIQGDPDAHTPGGESLTEVLDRFFPAVQEIVDRYASQPGELVFVSHSTVLSAALPFFFTNLSLGWALTTMLPAAGIATGEFIDGVWRCTDWDGTTPG